ncbi:hypothetical protein KC19_5G040800 [Ceratodon purpureus]|uniref:Cytochrome P450 n=1 Tax=Ceratodon purpureus TaxID=3225 RepID=A0A8T0HYS8_CERPU|nr:hypothetical protein KC19_5G040800 [Ceratodon purpureus]
MAQSSVTEAGANTAEAFWKSIAWGMSLESATVGVLVVTLVILYFLSLARERKDLPPGPLPWPVVGNLVDLASGGLPHIFLTKLASKYGGLMYLRLGSKPCIVISSAAAAKEMFRKSNEANFSSKNKGLFIEIISDNYRTLAHSPYGPHWRQLRRFVTSELFSPKRHASYQNAREDELRNMMRVLSEDCAKGDALKNLKSWFRELNANLMTKMLFNKSGDACREERMELEQSFEAILTTSMKSAVGDYIPSLRFITKLQGVDRAFKDLRDLWIQIGGKFMELEERRTSRADDHKQFQPDFVDLILAEPLDNGKPMSDTTLALQIMEFLFAGTDTGATVSEWAVAEVIGNPQVLKQAREELDAVVGGDRLMQESDIPNLPFLEAIVKEAFRLHPPVAVTLNRLAVEPAEAWGYTIPAGSQLTVNMYAIHRDPEVYENPDEFNPQRFIDRPEVNHLSGFDSYELIPFGLGRRMCPGANLGNTMVSLMLGNLIHSFDWSLPNEQSLESFRRDNKEERFGVMSTRKEPLVLVARPRDNVASC